MLNFVPVLGAMSPGNNKDMVDSLVNNRYIKNPDYINAFNCVDRGIYYLPEHKENAYTGTAYKSGNVHLSAPNVYCMAMENLKLMRGQSFLNIGSGTGYFSTMVGLLIGFLGVNHGVEIHADVVEYAQQTLEDLKPKLPKDFGEPIFVQGNGLCLSKESTRYDRVYCGAACPEGSENYMKNLIKVGGVLVMPFKSKLLQITRTAENQWEQKKIASVGFMALQPPSTADMKTPVVLPGPWKLPPSTADQRTSVVLPGTSKPMSSTSEVRWFCGESYKGNQEAQTSQAPNPPTQRGSGLFSPSFSFRFQESKVLSEAVKESLAAHSQTNSITEQFGKGDKEHTENGKEQLLESLKKVTDRLQELMECPVCFGTMDSALVQCKYGHGICGSCATKVKRCPSCEELFVVHQSTLLGKIWECLPKLCVYIDKGCSEIIFDKEHEVFCKYRPTVCKNTLCGWSGRVKDLIDHVKQCGKSKVLEIPANNTELQYFRIDKTQNMSVYTPIAVENQIFWQYFHRDVLTKRISYRFYHVAMGKPNTNYYFKVSFKKGKIEYTYSYKALLDERNDLVGTGDETGLIFTDSELERFRSHKENDEYECSIELVTEDMDSL